MCIRDSACLLRDGQGALIIGSCQFKLSQRFVRLTTCAIERGRWGIGKMGERMDSSGKVFESSAWCIEGKRLFSSTLSILYCL